MPKSILSNEKKCYRCENTLNLHKHHIFFGANRKWSEKYGCWVYLCGRHHNLSKEGVHSDRKYDLKLKSECQRAFEEIYSHEEFMKIFGRSWL